MGFFLENSQAESGLQLGDEAKKTCQKLLQYVNDIYIQKKCPSIPKRMIYGIRMLS